MQQGAPGLAALTDDPSPGLLRDPLHEVIDPELGVDIVELGLPRDVTVRAGVARIRFTVTTPACPRSGYIEDAASGRALTSGTGTWRRAAAPQEVSSRA